MISIKKLACFCVVGFSGLLPFSASAATDSITATVPFAFVVNGRTMPAGAYEVQSSDSSAVLYIRGSKSGAVVASNPGGAPNSTDKPGLVFERHGSTTYLVGVRMAAEGNRNLGSPVRPTEQGSAVALR